MVPEFSVDILYAAYVFVFAAAAVACLVTGYRAREIAHEETRRGLSWLLLTAGGWAAAHVGYLTAPTPQLQYVFYTIGLVIGWASVGPWLYFCSAYTGRSFHRNPTVRAVAVGLFLAVTAVKVTNPLHGWYFRATPATEPFTYLAITHAPLHWIATGLAYALAFLGFFVLFELFVRVNTNTWPLAALFGITGLPVVFDVLGALLPGLLDLTYSAIGVALFAVGTFVFYFDRLQFVRVAGETDDPVIVINDAGQVRDYNRRAAEVFPSVSDSIGVDLAERLPGLAAVLDNPDASLEREVDGEDRYFNVSVSAFTTGGARTGRSIVLSDVTARERYRRELETKNQKLEQFASIVSHDLRNPLQVAKGRTELAIETGEIEHLEPVVRAHDRMEQLIDEMLTLAREGVSIDETESVDIGNLARQSWGMVAAESASLVVADDAPKAVDADPERLQQLFENLFRNAVEHGSTSNRTKSDDAVEHGSTGSRSHAHGNAVEHGSTSNRTKSDDSVEHSSTGSRTKSGDAVEHAGPDVTVTVGALDGGEGFYVADDGPGIPPEDRESIFDPGFTTNAEGTGFGLAIVAEIVAGHGWEIDVTEGVDGGARFEIRTG